MEVVTDRNEGCDHISIDEQVLSNSLAKRLKHKLEKLSPLSPECCIYRVPAELRVGNEKSFNPQVISIGPLHHNNDKLKDMEEHKMRFLKDFLSRAQVGVDDCVELLKKKEGQLRNCYADPIELDSDKFIEIILIDAAFIVEVFLRNSSGNEVQNQHDHFFGRPWKLRFIKNDMLLLENQVPFFIIQDILSLTGSSIPIKNDVRLSAIKLTYEFFKTRMYLKDIDNFNAVEKVGQSEIQHFVDFARICHMPQEMPHKSKLKSLTIPTATQLHQAGVKFKVKQSRDLFDIQFKDGILEIPRLRINDAMENFLRNLIAYENYHLKDNYVKDYVFILDRLIDTADDVEMLAQNGIIESKLAGNQEVASVINKLSPGITLVRFNFYFSDLCKELNDYYRVPWHKWKATLKQDYFTNPWAIISVIAAIVLLGLTIVQTFYAVASYN
ncbi:UPF0481 protein At3g47200-like [Prosopis cineraria]|uniref:UPF0481 protein At3g47200-like n=1 Tax=Prosopis cineraria TaxID=364024 RepID=UPI00240FF6BE|nr:UPF0481 protein At3g47200-like [Prosopis cineraria]